MLTWPHPGTDWGRGLQQAEGVFLDIARAVTERERLLVVCRDPAHQEHVRLLLAGEGVALEALSLPLAPSNDSWARDHGPITILEDGTPRMMSFRFNGWGNKYPANLDAAITGRLHEAGAFGATPLERVELVLEGGSIDSDGQGTLLTTSRCLLSQQRNPGTSRIAMDEALGKSLGARRLLWLKHGMLIGDDTDGHVDMLARFCAPDTIVHTACDNSDDEHFRELQAMAAELARFRTERGDPYRLVPLPLPEPKRDDQDYRLPASYANFLIINGAVLVPVYGDAADDVALQRLGDCFPDRRLVAIPALPLIRQYGSLHCVTMQLPEGVL